MAQVKGIREYFDNDGKVVKTQKKNMGCVPDELVKNVFADATKQLIAKHRRDAMSRMNMFDIIEQNDTKVVMEIKAVLVFEYNQRITYYIA